MKAAILPALNEELVIRDDVSLADLQPGEVHIKIVSSGVCHSDVSAQNGTIPQPAPCVLGHEGAGTVLEVGPGVADLKAGDPVIVSFTPACRQCRACLRNQSYLCEAMGPMMSPKFIVDGTPMGGMAGCGTFAEEMILPESALVSVIVSAPTSIEESAT